MKSIAKFGIPVQALAIVATTLACESEEDPMIGDFVCSFYAYEGERFDCPNIQTVDEGGVMTETYQSFQLSVRADGSGSLFRVKEVKVDGTLDVDASSEEDFSLTGVMISEGNWNLSTELYELNLECAADSSVATCAGEDEDGRLWEFNWMPLGVSDIL